MQPEFYKDTPALFGILPYYGMILLLGGLVAAGWAYVQWNKKGYRTWDFMFLATWMLLFAIYGAKLWYIIFDPVNAFAGVNDILDVLVIIFIPAFGRSIIGTIVFVPIGIWLWNIYWGKQYRTLELLDIMMPAYFIAQAIGRWGNFVNQEVYGLVIDGEALNWLPQFIKEGMFIDGEYRTPLFLYESFADALGFITLILVFKTNDYWKEGTQAYSYFFLYGLTRACVELFRDPQFIMSWGPIPTTFITAIILMIVGLSMVIYLQWFKEEKVKA